MAGERWWRLRAAIWCLYRVVGVDVSAPQRDRGEREDETWFQDVGQVVRRLCTLAVTSSRYCLHNLATSVYNYL